ncbi:virR-like protein [Streptococcus pyogenes]|nr:virR-like protein [Streptococcus pyogenes]VGY10387.1 virR-like protein [Streptococcus pyogenes]VGY27628.1 virR-like protein [Streptococcus pyogenes]VGY73208.1 virR-like protein [Streptococcus pyogenes]VGZ56212.1 virR-like protein [Streptococcus pyogenes]
MVDMVSLSSEYDVIVTDMILEQTTDSEILFFKQMAPSVVANRLTDM